MPQKKEAAARRGGDNTGRVGDSVAGRESGDGEGLGDGRGRQVEGGMGSGGREGQDAAVKEWERRKEENRRAKWTSH